MTGWTIPDMTDDERQRWLAGRFDWRERDWQDHCGNVDCEQCVSFIPAGNKRVADARRRLLEAVQAL